jgi:TetR/AcrR family transcriptional repressor of bet genes
MPRPSQARARRAQLIAALMRTLADRGYAGASVASIAREAKLAPGLVHYYFGSKQEMLLELLASIRAAVQTRRDERLSRAGDDPRAKLFALTDALLEHDPSGGTAPVEATWVVIAAEAIHQPAVREAYGAMLLELVDRLEAGLREVLRAEGRLARDVRSLAAAIAAGIQGVYQMDAAAPGAAKRGSSAPALRHMVAGLIDAQPQRTRRPKRAK